LPNLTFLHGSRATRRFFGYLLWQAGGSRYLFAMDEPSPDLPKRRYRWPWVVLIAVIVWVLLSVLWVSMAVRHVREQRDFSAPPAGASVH
jgi:amino acid transporter